LFLVAAIVLLALVLVPGLGKEVNGSIRWVKLGPISMQASEPAKLCVIVYLAGYLVHFHDEVRNTLIGFLRPVVVLIAIAGLLLLEPDFGSTAVIFATTLGMLFLGGVSFTRFATWGGLAFAGLAGVAVMAPYRVKRLLNFWNPWEDQFNSGFQLAQALIAIGRGEWTGVGLGGSVLKMFYLPEAHTDFIFAVIAEEFGLAGSLTLVFLFGFLVLRALQIGGRAEEAGQLFGAYLSYGIGLWLGIQGFVNLGVNMGVLPTKGLTLPFISYGGNSLVVTCVALALLLRAEHESRYRSFNPYTHGGPHPRSRGGPRTYDRS
jgi:cell division protein FtsW